mmetsp:Transcript_41939/g.102838  ORF Transcript_41939/g.102838 Transcript_41939/m.102838 type:complete len:99 (+) Transcript_41939:2-298(+)
MENLSRLASLKMANNALQFLPSCILKMTTMNTLSVANNKIQALPPTLCLCTLLTSLDITWANVLVPPPETHAGGLKAAFSYLSELYLAGIDDSLRLVN